MKVVHTLCREAPRQFARHWQISSYLIALTAAREWRALINTPAWLSSRCARWLVSACGGGFRRDEDMGLSSSKAKEAAPTPPSEGKFGVRVRRATPSATR